MSGRSKISVDKSSDATEFALKSILYQTYTGNLEFSNELLGLVCNKSFLKSVSENVAAEEVLDMLEKADEMRKATLEPFPLGFSLFEQILFVSGCITKTCDFLETFAFRNAVEREQGHDVYIALSEEIGATKRTMAEYFSSYETNL